MTPKEKAKEIFDKHNCVSWNLYEQDAKDCAIITVNEILKTLEGLNKPEYMAFDSIEPRNYTFNSEYDTHLTGYDMEEYWQEVKQEIEKM